jgi:DNA polymerase-1
VAAYYREEPLPKQYVCHRCKCPPLEARDFSGLCLIKILDGKTANPSPSVTRNRGFPIDLCDRSELRAYISGDVYTANAIAFGWADPGATKKTAPAARSKAKVATLGLNYSMGARSLSKHMADYLYEAKIVKQKHRTTYRQFYDWTAAHTRKTLDEGRAAVLDWEIYTHPRHRPRITTLNNWPVQSTGAAMMRVALIMAVERGVSVRAPVHDAFAFCAPEDEYGDQQRALCESMEEASRIVLDGFTIDADVEKMVAPGQHYIDDRGVDMSRLMMETLNRLGKNETAA